MILSSILDQAGNSLGEALPRLGGALILLLVGLLIAWLAGRLVARALRAAGVDRLADRLGVHDIIARVGLEPSLARLLGRVVRIVLVFVVIVAAVSLLGFAALTGALNEALLFLPRVVAALVILLAGIVIAGFVGDRVGRLADQMDLGGPLGRLAQVGILVVFVLTALAQLGVPTELLTTILAIAIGAAGLAAALAFGLGSRDVARQVSAGRYVGGAFQLGQLITVDETSGEIIAIENAATLLRTSDGRTVRLPNRLLLESVVTIHEEPDKGTERS